LAVGGPVEAHDAGDAAVVLRDSWRCHPALAVPRDEHAVRVTFVCCPEFVRAGDRVVAGTDRGRILVREDGEWPQAGWIPAGIRSMTFA
jgi:hypothetical protein